jgi:hypothetical protein
MLLCIHREQQLKISVDLQVFTPLVSILFSVIQILKFILLILNGFIHDFLIGIKTYFVDKTTLFTSHKSPAPRIPDLSWRY